MSLASFLLIIATSVNKSRNISWIGELPACYTKLWSIFASHTLFAHYCGGVIKPLTSVIRTTPIYLNLKQVPMSNKENCTICLDVLFPSDELLITRLQPCAHYYHTDCIDLWRERSNTCPTCREDFSVTESVDIHGSTLEVCSVTKLTVNPSDFLFESALDVELQDAATISESDNLGRRIDMLVSRSNICILCDSRGSNITCCNTCSSNFHYACLGLNSVDFWVCPMCDAEQRNIERPSRFRRSRNSTITNRVYNQHRGSLNIPTGYEASEIIDVTLLMSSEERHAWEVFEQARKMPDTYISFPSEAISSSSSSAAPITERKFKKPSSRTRKQKPLATTPLATPPPPVSNENSSSLINQILREIKDNRQTQFANLKRQTRNQIPLQSRSSYSLPSLTSSPPASMNSSSISPSLSPVLPIDENEAPIHNKSEGKLPMDDAASKELTFEQKTRLQGIVRSKLKPIYQKGNLTEEQYTAINRNVSHILYDICLQDNDHVTNDFEQMTEFHVNEALRRL